MRLQWTLGQLYLEELQHTGISVGVLREQWGSIRWRMEIGYSTWREQCVQSHGGEKVPGVLGTSWSSKGE